MEKKIIKSLLDLKLPDATKASNGSPEKLEHSKNNDPLAASGEKSKPSAPAQSEPQSQNLPNQILTHSIQGMGKVEEKTEHTAKETLRLWNLSQALDQREAKIAEDQKRLSRELEHSKAERLAVQSRANQVEAIQRDCSDKEKANYKRAAELDSRQASLLAAEQKLLVQEARINQREIDLEDLLAEATRPEVEFKNLQATLESTKQELDRKCEEVSRLLEIQEYYERIKKKMVALEADYEESELALSDEVDEHVKTRREIKVLNHEISELNAELKILNQSFMDQNKMMKEVQRERDLLKGFETENASLRISVEERFAELHELNIELVELRARGMVSPFSVTSMAVLRWLSSEVSDFFQPPDDIITLGSGPIPEGDFDTYLRTLGIRACQSGCNWIVVGRSGWTPNQLDELIMAASNPSMVRIFSQELFIAGILTTHDPFEADPELLMEFAKGHPALEYLMKCGFEWPEIADLEELDVPQFVRGAYERVDESPIYRMGYVVGITNGLSAFHRQKLLREAYEGVIPQVEDADYMEEWGEPGTRKRLWRIGHHIAWLIRSRRSNPVMAYAVSDWEKDLEWLKIKYFKDSMRFSWPNF
ncbi:MAG: hypothetical protein WCL19_09360 [Verrucomicrobiota bacterium]